MKDCKSYTPVPVFDTQGALIEQYQAIYQSQTPKKIISAWLNHCFHDKKDFFPSFASKDYQAALNFLYSYKGSSDTFIGYRRELERLIQWSWFVKGQSLHSHKRQDIEAFFEFCLKPPKKWISLKRNVRFYTEDGVKKNNPSWRPFEVRVNKKEFKEGVKPNKNNYKLSEPSFRAMVNILSSFYNFLLQEEVINSNPIALIRQKSKFLQKQPKTQVIRRLSNKQWDMVIQIAKDKALKNPDHERSLFILSCLYGMYLRISELVANSRWTPTMGDFFKDSDNNWWFKTVSKGNKIRQIALSDSMLKALKRYREKYLKISPLPAPNEKTPLVGHVKNPSKSIVGDRAIRNLVQTFFDEAAQEFESQNDLEESNNLRAATVHWLRHTGISEDVKHRPREHVRDDAGHSSSAITDRYIDVELRERASSAKEKVISR